jgi:hypothetical protein
MQFSLADFDRLAPKIAAVQHQKIEGSQFDGS